MRTLTTGAAALLIAAIVGMLALAGVQAQEPSYSTPDDLRAAANALIAAVDRADVDLGSTDDRTDGQIVIDGESGPDTFERALAWVAWQEGRAAQGKATLPAFEDVQVLKAVYDETKESCEAALGGTCEWADLDPSPRGDATVLVSAVRESLGTYTVRVVEITPLGNTGRVDVTVGGSQLATLKADGNWRTQEDTLLTLGNGTTVGVTLRLLRDGRVEFGISSDRNRDGRYSYRDGGALPVQRFAPVNARIGRPLVSSPVSIAYTPTSWQMMADGS